MAPENTSIFDETENAASLSALWVLAVRFFREVGFDAGSYILLERSSDPTPSFVFDFGVPQELCDTYVEMDGRFSDPLIRVALSTGRPHLLSEFRAQYTMTPEEARLIGALKDHPFVRSINEMVALPLYGPAANNACVRLYSTCGPEMVDQVNLDALQMSAQHMHLKALALRPRGMSGSQILSRREIEILLWVAKGKSNSVIASILGIAVGTVDTYLRRIFGKLEVSDRTTAAVKGVSLGLIHV